MSNRTRKHIGWSDEVEPARKSGTTATVLCGRSIVPDGLDSDKPTCRQCDSNRRTNHAGVTYLYKVSGAVVTTWSY